ncbi:uncharacterized protein [Blastocystis hominis]|uniref:KOW domain-containing protein n=1 Tax=Blastocystis hominis TaxID=12968 RepID=D8MAR7_BLAHO|nr:uncharacterized protein [Blastocystis hominis]CBK25156.2 unnamed protein product [Blastocystis hominis]|eukprot:XP_012899204.1 uncharacterized protein [Blastocystis hominis]
MVKCLKSGKVVILTAGKYAGKKAVIVKVNEEGDGKYKFPYAVVCGVARPPRKVYTKMSEKAVAKRTSMRVFTKVVNLQHFMPTRYNVEFDFSALPAKEVAPEEKKAALKKIAQTFQQSYLKQNEITKERTKAGVAYLFKKLHF